GAGKYANGLLDVPGGARRAPGVGRMRGQLQRGKRIARTLEVEQQRDDRMSVRRDRQLALPALGEAPVAQQHLAHQSADQCEQIAALRGAEVAPALGQARDQRVRAAYALAE